MDTKMIIRKNLKALSHEEKKKAYTLLEKINVDISEGDTRLTGTKPHGFYLEGKYYSADHHREIMLMVAEIAAYHNPTQLNKFLEITGRKRTYFSRDHNDLSHDYKRINGTDIYAELNENATTLKKRCEAIILKYGLDLNSFKIV